MHILARRCPCLLKLENVDVYHGQSQVLKDISMHVKAGEIITLVGANGSGKSTLMGALAGLNPVRRGKVEFLGQDITNLRSHRIVAMGVSTVPERREIFDTLSVEDNLILGAYHRYRKDRPNIRRDIDQVLSLFPSLKGKEKRLAGSLSGGEQQMLAMGRGLMSKPRLLLLDEPSIGLAPLVIQEIFKILLDLNQLGTTILLIEQNAQLALGFSERAYVLERGSIVLEGESSCLLKDPRIQAAYLGKRTAAN
jgi:branched-chain amino acid transport system ATP-binding protein